MPSLVYARTCARLFGDPLLGSGLFFPGSAASPQETLSLSKLLSRVARSDPAQINAARSANLR